MTRTLRRLLSQLIEYADLGEAQPKILDELGVHSKATVAEIYEALRQYEYATIRHLFKIAEQLATEEKAEKRAELLELAIKIRDEGVARVKAS